MKRVIGILPLLLIMCYSPILAMTFTVNGLTYETIDNNLNVYVAPPVSGTHYSGSISVESSVYYEGRTYTVKAIGKNAFAERSDYTGARLTSIDIDNSIEKIDDSAFRNCTGLTSIEIPNRTTEIGVSAFEGCSSMTKVTLGSILLK